MNAKLSEYAAAIGIAAFDDVLIELDSKKKLSKYLISNLPGGSVLDSFSPDTVYQAIPFIASSAKKADITLEELAKIGVESKHYYRPLTGLPNSKKIYESSVCVPCHSKAATRAEDILKVLKRNL